MCTLSRNTRRIALAGLAAGSLLAPAAGAGIITGTSTGSGGGGLWVNTSSVSTPAPGNDNVLGASPNTLLYDQTFSSTTAGSATFTNAGGPPTEYSVHLDVKNSSGVAWSGYTVYVGAGTMDFPTYTNWFTLDFDLAPTISGAGGSPAWSSPDNNWLVWSGLNVTPGSTIQLEFNLDLPFNTSGGWGIAQRPTPVPAPASLALLACGVACAKRRR
jgi:hypothetical protein